jgi:hypothetical protein
MVTLLLRQVAHALGGKVVGRQVRCPGPGHSRRDDSLSVMLDQAAPDGFLVHSFAGDDPMQCRDHVRTLLSLPAWAPNSGAHINDAIQHKGRAA